jgi:hypothetical protein
MMNSLASVSMLGFSSAKGLETLKRISLSNLPLGVSTLLIMRLIIQLKQFSITKISGLTSMVAERFMS